MVRLDGFDDAILGKVIRVGMDQPVLLYDTEKILANLMQTMNRDDALDFFSYNILGVWAGDGTPVFTHIADFESEV